MLHPVYLVRHGQSEWNVAGLTQGQTTAPCLTQLGRRQAARVARCLPDLLTGSAGEVRLHTSDLCRAVETAELIGNGLGVTPRPDTRFRERHFGRRQGRRHAVTTRLLRVPGLEPVLGVEPARAVEQRVRAALAALDPNLPHIVVTHGEVIRVLMGSGRGVVPNAAVVCLQRRSTEHFAATPRT